MVLILVLVIGLLAGVVSSALSAWIFEDEHAIEYRKVIPHLAIKTVSETTIKLLQTSLKERDQSVEALRARIEELEKKNLELK